TLPPVCTTAFSGLKLLSLTSTAAEGGGADAVVLNVTEGNPVTVAFTTYVVAVPSVWIVVATPFAFVVLGSGLRLPPPVTNVQSTETPGTARPFASRTVTLYGTGSGLLKYPVCPSPPLFTTSAGGPGGSVLSLSQANVNSPTPRAPSRCQRNKVIVLRC